MVSYVLLSLAALSVYWAFGTWRSLQRNLAAAKQSGIPYVVSPVYAFTKFWLITHRLWLPVLERLPKSWTSSWIDLMTPDWTWHLLHEPFAKHGDSFLVVAPSRNTLYVAGAEAISQITSRRNDFPKPIEMYAAVDVYGKNVVSTEGSVWRHHRRITSTPFTEKSNLLVWRESLHQAQSMLKGWVGPNDSASALVEHIAEDTMRLSLHVISRAGFGVRLFWPHESAQNSSTDDDEDAWNPPTEGHSMTYTDALSTLLDHLPWVMLVNKRVLEWLPFKQPKIALQSFNEWGNYMNEIYEAKVADVRAGKTKQGMDLMGTLVGFSNEQHSGVNEKTSDGDAPKTTPGDAMLSKDEILGNAFVFILAGHETAANTIHFSLLYLALHRNFQEQLQEEVDAIFGDKPISEWDYDHDLPKLFGGMVGAVMNEELRLLPPVINIPKSTPKDAPQSLTLNGRKVVVPQDTYIQVSAVVAHRNPNNWPTSPPSSTTSGAKNDLDEFNPGRWLTPSSESERHADDPHATGPSHEDFGGPDGNDTSSSMYHPRRGAYIPFSDGPRACLGRRFAQIEVLAVLAVIFRDYSVELDVGAYASPEEVRRMAKGGPERSQVWRKAADRAEWLLKHGMMTIITIQMRGGRVPLRFVRRGEEQFVL